MNCPRCGGVLGARIYEADIRVDECAACHGVWLDRGELVRIEETVTGGPAPALLDAVAAAYERARQLARPDIACPKCGGAMTKTPAHPAAPVIIDVCAACDGAWLDGGEAQALEAFCAGMHLEQKRELQRGFFAHLGGRFGL